jgi:hypothetical protein
MRWKSDDLGKIISPHVKDDFNAIIFIEGSLALLELATFGNHFTWILAGGAHGNKIIF